MVYSHMEALLMGACISSENARSNGLDRLPPGVEELRDHQPDQINSPRYG